jgi:hypothetical protein
MAIDYAPLHSRIVADGIPLKGIRVRDNKVELIFKPEATLEHQNRAQTMLANYDPLSRDKRIAAAKQYFRDNRASLTDAQKHMLVLIGADL